MPNITLVIQWRASCDLCTLWQRFGRAARDFAIDAIALFLVEPMYFDETREEKATRKAKRQEKVRQKAVGAVEKVRLGKRKQTDGIDQDYLTCSSHFAPNQPPIHSSHASVESPLPSALDLHSQFVAASFTMATLTIPPMADTPQEPIADSTLSEDEISDNEDMRDMVTLQAERRELYLGVLGSEASKFVHKRKNRKKDGNELAPALDDTINAGSPGRCFKCFRAPANLYFSNDIAGK